MDNRAIQAHLRGSIASRAERVGPFLLLITPDTDTPGRNYAIPDDAATPTASDVTDLIAAFERHRRSPRLEYLRPAPAVDAALAAAGFTTPSAYPVLLLDPGAGIEPPAPPGYTIGHATTEDDFRGAAEVQQHAYEGGPVTEHDVARLRNVVTGGGTVAVARTAAGEYVGTGLHTPPLGGTVEIAAVGVLDGHRRRGIAAALTYVLSVAAQQAGVVPFLQAEGADEQRIYHRLGYRTVGELANPRR